MYWSLTFYNCTLWIILRLFNMLFDNPNTLHKNM